MDFDFDLFLLLCAIVPAREARYLKGEGKGRSEKKKGKAAGKRGRRKRGRVKREKVEKGIPFKTSQERKGKVLNGDDDCCVKVLYSWLLFAVVDHTPSRRQGKHWVP